MNKKHNGEGKEYYMSQNYRTRQEHCSQNSLGIHRRTLMFLIMQLKGKVVPVLN
jgi:hypothetical protein